MPPSDTTATLDPRITSTAWLNTGLEKPTLAHTLQSLRVHIEAMNRPVPEGAFMDAVFKCLHQAGFTALTQQMKGEAKHMIQAARPDCREEAIEEAWWRWAAQFSLRTFK